MNFKEFVKNEDEIIEKLSDLEHEQWSHWMKYLFSKCDSDYKIPKELVERWKEQTITKYVSLTEKEKESDREWARKAYKIIKDNLK